MKENIFSNDKKIETDFEEKLCKFYNQLFPNLTKIIKTERGGSEDKKGIDRILKMLNEKDITIQEKIRRNDFNDLLVEFWHNNKT